MTKQDAPIPARIHVIGPDPAQDGLEGKITVHLPDVRKSLQHLVENGNDPSTVIHGLTNAGGDDTTVALGRELARAVVAAGDHYGASITGPASFDFEAEAIDGDPEVGIVAEQLDPEPVRAFIESIRGETLDDMTASNDSPTTGPSL